MSSILEAYLGLTRRTGDEETLRALLDLGRQLVDAVEGSLLILDEPQAELEFVFVVGRSASDARLTGQRVPVGQGVTGLAAFTGEVQIGATSYAGVEQPDDRIPDSVLAAPLVLDDRLLGVMTAVRFAPMPAFDRTAVEPFGNLAHIAAALLAAQFQLHDLARDPARARVADAVLGSPEEQALLDAIGRLIAAGPERLPAITRIIDSVADLVPGPRRSS